MCGIRFRGKKRARAGSGRGLANVAYTNVFDYCGGYSDRANVDATTQEGDTGKTPDRYLEIDEQGCTNR